MSLNKKIVFTAFYSKKNKELSTIFQNNFHKTLDKYNLKEKVKSAHDYWLKNNNVYCLLVHSEDFNIIYGGARLEIKITNMLLPMEKLLLQREPKIGDIISDLQKDGVGEICSLWKNLDLKINPLDVSLLIMATISLMKQLNLKTVVSLSSKPIENIVKSIGVQRYSDVGDNGVFEFVGKHVAIFDYYKYPDFISYGDMRNNKIIRKLFNSPNTSILQKNNNISLEYLFNLKLS